MTRPHSKEPEIDYLSLLLAGEFTRQALQSQAAYKPESTTSKKIREALAIHAVVIAVERLCELKRSHSITTT